MMRTNGAWGSRMAPADESPQGPFLIESDLAAGLPPGPISFEEILVRVSRMELHDLDLVFAGEISGQCLCDVGLSGSGRAVEDELGAVADQVDTFL